MIFTFVVSCLPVRTHSLLHPRYVTAAIILIATLVGSHLIVNSTYGKLDHKRIPITRRALANAIGHPLLRAEKKKIAVTAKRCSGFGLAGAPSTLSLYLPPPVSLSPCVRLPLSLTHARTRTHAPSHITLSHTLTYALPRTRTHT